MKNWSTYINGKGKFMLNSNFLWLMNWYSLQCDGDWEQSFGIKIKNLDNPGWRITVSIQETILRNKDFEEIQIERTDEDWIFCKIENGFFDGCCGIFNLEELLQTFRSWVEA
jgi:hypothetical protein